MKRLIILTFQMLVTLIIVTIWYYAFEFAWYLITKNTTPTKYDDNIHDLIVAILAIIGLIKGINWYMKKYHKEDQEKTYNIEPVEKIYKIDIDFFN